MQAVCPIVKKPRISFIDERLTRLPNLDNLGFLLQDIKEIGISHGGAPVNDQNIYYYSKLNNIDFTSSEITLIKLASRSFLNFDTTGDFAPYMPRK